MSDREGDPMETRLEALEERVRTLEALLGAPAEPSRAPDSWPVTWQPATPRPGATPPQSARPPLDLEELLGGRVLGWAGGIAVVVAAIFFLVMAVSNGWIDEPTRVVLAFAASTALLGAGVWLYERKGQTQAALAAVAAALAALYASDTTASVVYHLVSPAVGLVLAGLIGVAATAIAVRWDSRVVAGIGIVGALLAPVLVDAGRGTTSLAFMAPALVSAVAVVVWRRWSWLASIAYVVSGPQLAGWLEHERHQHLGLSLVVLGVFWALFVVAALGYELRVPTTTLRLSSASLLFLNAAATAGGGWAMLHNAGNGMGATAWVLAVAAAHVVVGIASLRGRVSREIGLLLAAVGAALAGVGIALALDGPALVAGWTAEGVLLAAVARRTGDRRGSFGGVAFLSAATAHVLLYEAPPRALAYGLDSVPKAAVALVLLCLGFTALALMLRRTESEDEALTLGGVAAVLALYLGSVVIVDLTGAHAGGVTQMPQLALSAFWATLGFGSLVVGLARELKPLRLAGLALLGLAIGKVFVVDLSALQSIWRVGSFLALGLLLLAAAFAYQRTRREGSG
jgi:uncharacterized membrane protein